MASIVLHLKSKPKTPPFLNPSFVHFSYSTSESNKNSNSSDDSNDRNKPASQSSSSSSSSFASLFSDIKASLKQQPPHHQHPSQPPSARPFSPSARKSTSTVASLEEIRKNLSEFRRRSAGPPAAPSGPPSQQQHISFQELYKRNVIGKSNDLSTSDKGQKPSFEEIRESLRHLGSTAAATARDRFSRGADPLSLAAFKDSLKLRPSERDSPLVIGGSEALPVSVFGKEMKAKKDKGPGADSAMMRTEFVKMYSYKELGQKLRMLRPEAKGENWFSLGELNERLIKLREVEEKETESRIGGVSYRDLRESLVKLSKSDEEKAKQSSIQKLHILGDLGGTPTFMLAPPKEHLVEKYFHPDNMSSAAKLKLELQKVRDEYKMSESDCGSARVQVAQLTTKIKHLSSVLHKKDKHSRKGLLAMVQRRKKLLKYMRRTDWDSYCLVLSGLGLRDTPELKIR